MTQDSARIIPFPLAGHTGTARPADRLAVALADLNAALDAQRAAVAGWRASLGALGSQLRSTEAALAD